VTKQLLINFFVQLREECLNTSTELSSRFFDVSLGTYRHMDVTVRTIRDVSDWDVELYLSFFKEVNSLRFAGDGDGVVDEEEGRAGEGFVVDR